MESRLLACLRQEDCRTKAILGFRVSSVQEQLWQPSETLSHTNENTQNGKGPAIFEEHETVWRQ